MLKKNNGFSLLEVLVAMVLMSLVFVTISSLITKSLSMSQHADDRTIATNYIQETMEYYRYQRDTANSWEDFVSDSCVINAAINEPTPAATFTGFNRTIDIIDPDGVSDCSDNVEIVVSISWENNRYHTNSSTIFSKWN